MLESIRISNLALIDKSSVSFSSGFNVLTGETGAGKSLIVDALLFLTGVRADKTLIKSGEDNARVEGVFSVDTTDEKVNEILFSVGLENEGTVIISRQFSLNGKSECRVNGELVTLNIIRKLSNELIDIFGQNDSQVLLDSSNHLALLDNMFEDVLRETKASLSVDLQKLSQINFSIRELGGLDKDRENNINFLKFQIKEIDDANLQIGQEEELKSKIVTMQNSEKIFDALNNSCNALNGEMSVENTIKSTINTLSGIEKFDEDISKLKERLYSIRYEMQDIVDTLDNKKNSIYYSEQDLDNLQEKLMGIKDLERKYGNTIEEILNTKEKLNASLSKLLNADEELERLTLDKKDCLQSILEKCQKLHAIRVREIAKFRGRLIEELKELGMKSAEFDVHFLNDITIDNIEKIVNENGADNIEFLFSANLGVEPRPLDKIISGGEMSRFMLAFKSLQNVNKTKTCIFDEIDTGIGGEIGVVIGKKICKISSNTQVICITHLAQIASFGDSNFKIEKYETDSNTVTNVKLLNSEEKVTEIARMLGNSISQASISNASEIIENATGYKQFLKSSN